MVRWVFICTSLLIALSVVSCGPQNDALAEFQVSGEAPDFEGVSGSGKQIKLSELRGKVVLLDFWKTQCPPCIASVPHNQQLVEKYRDKPFVLVGVNVDPTEKMFLETQEKLEMTWESIWDGGDSRIFPKYDVLVVPTYYLIDHKGQMRYLFKGAVEEELDKAVAQLMSEIPKP